MVRSARLTSRLDQVLAGLPRAYPGPGGAVAVLRRGEVLARHTWGWANAERRIPFTPASLFRMCSVTKQFTCALVLDACGGDPGALDGAVRARLPHLAVPAPTARHLCDNQSGLRDYWAVAMLHGSPAEAPFGGREAARVIEGTRTLQFAPGSSYSYVNQNFRILADAVAEREGEAFGTLLRRRVFDRAGMPTALLAADTRAMPDGTEGYEGTQASGFRPAVNRIVWTGDAGLGASLDDMIAWERFVDATRDDGDELYRRLCAPVSFADGVAAPYGFGLSRRPVWGHPATGHGGALRGWRSHRVYLHDLRVSVVVMFNHMADAHAAAEDLLAVALDEARPRAAPAGVVAAEWAGAYLEPGTGLSVRLEPTTAGLVLRYDRSRSLLQQNPDGTAGDDGTRLSRGADGLRMERTFENRASALLPLGTEVHGNVAGRYRCTELDAELTLADAGGALYGAFSGELGAGRMELLDPVGSDVWALPCPRALDHTPPGDWTLAVERAGDRPVRVRVGCWLARDLAYERVG